jgi:isopenicillin N synthase-like dioxygenase
MQADATTEPGAVVRDGFVPVIDLSPAMEGDADARRTVAQAIGKACEESGFLVIVGHGVDAELIDRTYALTDQFFRLPDADKARVETTDTDLRGWKREGGYVAASSGFETPPDLCEMFTYNRLGDPGVAETSGLGDALDAMSGANQWPDRPEGFRETWLAYYAALEALGSEMMRLFALALDLPEDWFEDKLDHHMTNLCANWYYPLTDDPLAGQFRKGPHTDWGSLTILYQDDAGGLQVRDKDGEWVDVPCIPGSYVVNIGDLMAVWTNDRWVSTMHRVVPPPSARAGVPRISIPFFHQPNYDAVVECLPSCHSATDPARHEPITSGAWLYQKLQAAYGGVQGGA